MARTQACATRLAALGSTPLRAGLYAGRAGRTCASCRLLFSAVSTAAGTIHTTKCTVTVCVAAARSAQARHAPAPAQQQHRLPQPHPPAPARRCQWRYGHRSLLHSQVAAAARLQALRCAAHWLPLCTVIVKWQSFLYSPPTTGSAGGGGGGCGNLCRCHCCPSIRDGKGGSARMGRRPNLLPNTHKHHIIWHGALGLRFICGCSGG
jgi:hypothetical protein